MMRHKSSPTYQVWSECIYQVFVFVMLVFGIQGKNNNDKKNMLEAAKQPQTS